MSLIDHAKRLIDREGDCDGEFIDRCEDCFINDYGHSPEYCDSEIAYECATLFLDDAKAQGVCVNIWTGVSG